MVTIRRILEQDPTRTLYARGPTGGEGSCRCFAETTEGDRCSQEHHDNTVSSVPLVALHASVGGSNA